MEKQCKGLGDCGKMYHEDASGGLLEPFSDEKGLCVLVIFLMLLEGPGLYLGPLISCGILGMIDCLSEIKMSHILDIYLCL